MKRVEMNMESADEMPVEAPIASVKRGPSPRDVLRFGMKLKPQTLKHLKRQALDQDTTVRAIVLQSLLSQGAISRRLYETEMRIDSK